MSEADPNGHEPRDAARSTCKAGPQRVSAAFIERSEGPVDDLIAPIDYTLADTQIGSALGITTLPHLRDLAITGPHKVTGVSERRAAAGSSSAGRRRRPKKRRARARSCAARGAGVSASGERRRCRGLMSSTTRAGRTATSRPASDGAAGDSGEPALPVPPRGGARRPSKPGQNYRISDLDLGSRLSFFLWGSASRTRSSSTLASRARCRTPACSRSRCAGCSPIRARRRSRRASRRSGCGCRTSTRFIPTRCSIRSSTTRSPSRCSARPSCSSTPRARGPQRARSAHRRLHVRQRAAREALRHSRTSPATSSGACTLTDENRRGLLGHGSILMLTSVADRTSPVLRGKWVMEVLLGIAAAAAAAERAGARRDQSGVAEARLLSVRERMEEHRTNPACTSCHRVIDPLGLALENFDVTGAWRIKDNGVADRPAGSSTTARRSTGRRAAAGAAEALGRRAHELHREPDDVRARPAGRVLRHADVRAIVRDAAKNEQPHLGVHPRRRQERGVPDEPSGSAERHSRARQERRSRRSADVEEVDDAMFITKKHISRRTVLRGMGVTLALPLLDAMVPARHAAREDRGGRQDAPRRASRWCTARPAARRSASRRTCGRRRRWAASST